MVTSKLRMIFSRLPADVKATGFSRYVVYFHKYLLGNHRLHPPSTWECSKTYSTRWYTFHYHFWYTLSLPVTTIHIAENCALFLNPLFLNPGASRNNECVKCTIRNNNNGLERWLIANKSTSCLTEYVFFLCIAISTRYSGKIREKNSLSRAVIAD